MKFLLSFLLIISWTAVSGQTTTPNRALSDLDNEQIFVHTNSTFLITGETLYFKIFCRQRDAIRPSMLSKVTYLELVNEQAKPVFQIKIAMENGAGQGDLFIPSTFSTGNYSLIAYTQWMRNFGADSYYKKEITIVNPFDKFVASSTTGNKISPKTFPALPQSTALQIELSAKKFKTREKVSVTLTCNDVVAVSISVRKKEKKLNDAGTMLTTPTAGDSVRSGTASSSLEKNSQSSPSSKLYVPEIRGHLISGKLTPKGQGTSKRTVLASIPGTDFVFRAVATDQYGNFNVLVNHIPESSTMIFQVQDDDINNYTLKLDDPFLGDYSKFKPEPLLVDTVLQAIIDERNIYTQIENAYYEAKEDSVPFNQSSSFYNVPDKIYKLDDFTRFPTMEDIFREYILEVILKHSRNSFSLQVVAPRFGDPVPKEPLMLIDGVPILNTNTLMAFDPLKVERIEIIREKYFYGALDIDGIVSLKTYKGSLEDLPAISSRKESLVKMQSDKMYFFPDYSTDKTKLERVPDYRIQLYWNPEIKVSGDHGTRVDFYTSDLTGDFEIIAEGFSDGGKLISAHEVISVSNKD